MASKANIMALGGLVLALLTLAILVGVTFLVSNSFQDSLCNDYQEGAQYNGASCFNSSETFTTDPIPVQRVETVTGAIVTVLSFLSILVIVGIAAIVLRVARGMSGKV